MAKRTFKVHAASSDTGLESVLHIEAESVQQALEKAAHGGWLVSHVEGATLPGATGSSANATAPVTTEQAELEALRREVQALHATVKASRLVKDPIQTIAWGVCVGTFLTAAVLIIVGVVLAALGVLVSPLTR